MAMIFKICSRSDWARAETAGCYRGSELDRRDGFIHFSAANQVCETAARHFAGQSGLVLVAVEEEALAASLRWEPSRGGALFPHLYGDLPSTAVAWVKPLPWKDGEHEFPLEIFA